MGTVGRKPLRSQRGSRSGLINDQILPKEEQEIQGAPRLRVGRPCFGSSQCKEKGVDAVPPLVPAVAAREEWPEAKGDQEIQVFGYGLEVIPPSLRKGYRGANGQ